MLELARGGEPRLLIDSDALEDQAAFAPDGRSIAFVSTASGNADVYTLPFTPNETVEIGAARHVTDDPGGEFLEPAFAPDGRTLAFSSDRGLPVATPLNPRSIMRLRYGDLYAVDLATSTTTRLTDAPGWDGSPAWSHDGNTITLSERGRRLDHSNTGLLVMNADGLDSAPWHRGRDRRAVAADICRTDASSMRGASSPTQALGRARHVADRVGASRTATASPPSARSPRTTTGRRPPGRPGLDRRARHGPEQRRRRAVARRQRAVPALDTGTRDRALPVARQPRYRAASVRALGLAQQSHRRRFDADETCATAGSAGSSSSRRRAIGRSVSAGLATPSGSC